MPRGVFAEDPEEVDRFLAGIEASFPTTNAALAQIAAQIASNLLRQRRLAHHEAELRAGSGRATGDIVDMTTEQAQELRILDAAPLVLTWIMKQQADKVENDARRARLNVPEVDSETVGRFLHHALLMRLIDELPDLVAAPTPDSPQSWDQRIRVILDACFHDDEDVFAWAMEEAVKAEARAARMEVICERAAVRAADEVLGPVAVIRSRLVRELRQLVACYREVDEIARMIAAWDE